MRPEHLQRSLQRVEQVIPSSTVDRGSGPVVDLPVAPADLTAFEFEDQFGVVRSVEQYVTDGHVDALLLWHDGAIRQEVFRNGQTPRSRHIVFSVTKSFTGLLAEMLIDDGLLDDRRLVSDYVAELGVDGGAYADATVRQVLDMEIGIDFTEVYADPQSDIQQFGFAAGFQKPRPGVPHSECLYDYLPTLRKKGEHGVDFHYVTANSEVLGWIIERVANARIDDLLGERVYQHLGADRDAFYVTDPVGKAVAGGGLCITAPDLLRLGLLMQRDGEWNGRRIVPASVVAGLKAGGTPRPSLWGNETGGTDYSYRSQWYFQRPDQLMYAQGIHGQMVFVSMQHDAVMVVNSSFPDASNDFFVVAEKYFVAVTEHLNRG